MKASAASLALAAAACVMSVFALWPARRREEAPPRNLDRPEAPAGGLHDPRLRKLQEKVSDLELRIEALRTASGNPQAEDAALRAIVLDSARTPAERVSAFRIVRSRSADGCTQDMILSILALLRSSGDAAVRLEICRQCSGLGAPQVRHEMLERVRTDPDEWTRVEAIATLSSCAGEADVRPVLEAARDNDPSGRVRAQAAAALDQGEPK
ncbi:MAG: hypothetical protein FD180_2197 [Planctomycetota bacterium]|nr:MAG: hypothetical protein FD180_2197 [Planctomycetota bacterium]